MPTLPIVEALGELKERATRLVMGPEGPSIEQFTLYGRKKALSQGVIVTIPGRAHRTPDTEVTTLLAESLRGILASMIRMVDEARARMPVPDGHAQGCQDELGSQMLRHGPAHYSATEDVHELRLT